MTAIEIINPGPFSTIQDTGRPGLSRLGIPTGGAMDRRALAAANILVGNCLDEAVIELSFIGGRFRALDGDIRLALCGGHAGLKINGRPVDHHCSFVLREGETLEIESITTGVYAVLSIEGGLNIERTLGSRASDQRSALGAFGGRPLAAGDTIALNQEAPSARAELSIRPLLFEPKAPIRIILGPQQAAFTEAGLRTFLNEPFLITPRISRMAYIIEGPVIEQQKSGEMISDGTLTGSIQVPQDGRPIVMMADRQTIGGYPKIATIISADIDRFAQRRPGEKVRFKAVSVEEAHHTAKASNYALQLKESAMPSRTASGSHRYRLEYLADAVVDAFSFRSTPP